MRHAFSFPIHIREAIRSYVRQATDGINPKGFDQEPSYTAALLGRLAGVAYAGSDGSVIFKTTNVNSIARGAAERWSGADLAITADIQQAEFRVSKAILAQAKLGSLENFSRSERDRLIGQIREMRRLTRSPKVLLVREINGRREPMVASGVRIAEGLPTQILSLPDYFIRRILTTFDGDTRPEFVNGVQESSLEQLHVMARLAETVNPRESQ